MDTVIPGAAASRQELPVLTSLRGVAALAVLVFHTTGGFRGYLAVDLFFMLSGFVLMHAYGTMVVTRESYLRFLGLRLARIYPVHLLVLVLLLPLLNTRPDFSFESLASSLLLLQSPWRSGMCWNYAAWSISAEWHAYLLFPFLISTYRDRSNAGLAMTLVVCTAVLGWIHHVTQDGNIASTPAVFARFLPEFIAGMCLYVAYRRGSLARFGSNAAAAAIVTSLFVVEVAGLPDVVVVVLLGALLASAAVGEGWMASVLDNGPARYLGRISYSLYMVQMVPMVLLPAQGFWRGVVFFSSTFVLAAIVSILVEYPARDWIRRLLSRSPVRQSQAAVS
jgi:peptidoglycan/LPS O-acetylase OafA/YrhL